MKLTDKDKELLVKWGYVKEDFRQIEKATTKTIYELNDKKISCKKALEVLGREKYLSGISRSAFHYTAVRYNDNGDEVYFNSSKLFN